MKRVPATSGEHRGLGGSDPFFTAYSHFVFAVQNFLNQNRARFLPVPDLQSSPSANTQVLSQPFGSSAASPEIASADAPDNSGLSIDEVWQQFFVRMAQSVGLPKSVGLIYGHLFVSNRPLPFEDLVEQLPLSKGSVSQGLRVLQRLRAVRPIVQAQDRRSFFEAETSMRKLVGGFLHETVRPRLEQAEEELEQLASRLGEDHDKLLRQRVDSMRHWHAKALRLLPWVVKLTAPPPREDPDGW